MSDKKTLRARMRVLRDAISAEQRSHWSRRICERAIALPAYHLARVVHCFLSIQSEVDTRPLIEHALAHGKRVVVPVFVKGSDETPCTEILSLDDDAFETGRFNLRVPKAMRPVATAEIDLVFVPLLAFAAPEDASPAPQTGKVCRLGYGVGYYDRLLSRLRAGAPKIGLAFALQRVPEIPMEPHDIPLDAVITEDGCLPGAP
ncbi:MAG: 5-formyltetrahydrofolate cyclo-ligase [Candidatus Roseilinea sp.]|uniref:5-formyltetrahydrofolate cyclo-ligase n=1 Tax=Candidatus Roseilinea sp. TaxID=2838777 RepID=UPI00404AA521